MFINKRDSIYVAKIHMTLRHLNSTHIRSKMDRFCAKCDRSFTTPAGLQQHKRTSHGFTVGYKCKICDQISNRRDMYTSHFLKLHPSNLDEHMEPPAPILLNINKDEEKKPYQRPRPYEPQNRHDYDYRTYRDNHRELNRFDPTARKTGYTKPYSGKNNYYNDMKFTNRSYNPKMSARTPNETDCPPRYLSKTNNQVNPVRETKKNTREDELKSEIERLQQMIKGIKNKQPTTPAATTSTARRQSTKQNTSPTDKISCIGTISEDSNESDTSSSSSASSKSSIINSQKTKNTDTETVKISKIETPPVKNSDPVDIEQPSTSQSCEPDLQKKQLFVMIGYPLTMMIGEDNAVTIDLNKLLADMK